MGFFDVDFFVMAGKVVLIDVVLGGDNAVVIALASRNLPVRQRKQAVIWGTLGAIAMRVALTVMAVTLLRIPFLKLIGGLLLIWIAVKLLTNAKEDRCEINADSLTAAIKTIVFADLVMSIDNILALAGVARDNIPLLLFGLALSIPLIMWGSNLILRLMVRFPLIITLGAGLLGYTAGEMIVADAYFRQLLPEGSGILSGVIPVAATVCVVLSGRLRQRKRRNKH